MSAASHWTCGFCGTGGQTGASMHECGVCGGQMTYRAHPIEPSGEAGGAAGRSPPLRLHRPVPGWHRGRLRIPMPFRLLPRRPLELPWKRSETALRLRFFALTVVALAIAAILVGRA